MKNWKIDRIISVATLVVALAALILVLRKPAAVAPSQTSSSASANRQSASGQLSQSGQSSQPNAASSATSQNSQAAVQQAVTSQQSGFGTEKASQKNQSQQAQPQNAQPQQQNAQISADELSAAIAQAAGAIPGSAGGQLSPNSDLGSMPAIKDQQVSFDGDVVHGRFLTTIAGKDVWITISGHLGDKDGYATFDPTEFKVGDINVPVSLVNGPLQEKLAEQRDKMKLPD